MKTKTYVDMIIRKELSILIPVYNDICINLVQRVNNIAQAIKELDYEVIVADDGSTNEGKIIANEQYIKTQPKCRYIRRNINVGRAAIRNFLAREAQFEWLLFLDCDVEIPNQHFISNYLNAEPKQNVIYGGLTIGGDFHRLKTNLRYIYERSAERKQTAENRSIKPYQSFRTTNFLIAREIMLQHSFDETIKTYGYEDVMFGKQLYDSGINVTHINNQVEYTEYEENGSYLKKTEEAMRTLYSLKGELASYSSIIVLQQRAQTLHLSGVMNIIFRVFRNIWRANLLSSHPILAIYNAYRLFYFNSLCTIN